MQKSIAIAVLQSLVSEHNSTSYQEALDCIKKELAEKQEPAERNGAGVAPPTGQSAQCKYKHSCGLDFCTNNSDCSEYERG